MRRYLLMGVLAVVQLCLAAPGLAAAVEVKAGPETPAALTAKVGQAARATTEFYRARYGVELERPVDIVLVTSKEEYEQVMVAVLKFSPEAAAKYARHNKGVSSWHVVTYRLDGQSSLRNVYMHIAHELTHTYQRQLATTKAPGRMSWLWEGMANVMAARIVEEQGIRTVAETRRGWLDYVRKQDRRPELKALLGQEQWLKAMDVYGIDSVYDTATLAVDYLMQRQGYDALVAYVRAARTADRAAAFQQAFGMELAEFYAAFAGYLAEQLKR